MLEVKNLKKRFGDFEAVKGVSFSVKEGEVLGFLGPNGAGKSTTMRMITGFLPPTSGTAVVDGHDIVEDPIAAKRALGYLPESAPSYRAMTVRDYLSFIASVRHDACPDPKKAVADVIVKAKLEKVAGQTIETSRRATASARRSRRRSSTTRRSSSWTSRRTGLIRTRSTLSAR